MLLRFGKSNRLALKKLKILTEGQSTQIDVDWKNGPNLFRRCDLLRVDQAAYSFKYDSVDRFGKMLLFQKYRDTREHFVIGQNRAEETLLSWKLIGGILAVLLLVGFGAYKVFGNSKPTDAAKPDNVNAAPADPDPNAPVSAEKDITDAFTGTSAAGLGTADTGQLWETPTGTWGKADGHAYLVDPNKEGGNRSMAVIDLKSGNGSVTVTAAKMTPSWGLVFRYKGPFNYWMLVASPKFGTYNLVKVEDGKATSVGNSGLTKQDAGTVVGVTFQGDQVAIVVDGVQAAAFTDGAFATATKVGLVAADQTAKDAQWSAFSAKTLAGKAPPGAKKAPTTTAAKQAGP